MLMAVLSFVVLPPTISFVPGTGLFYLSHFTITAVELVFLVIVTKLMHMSRVWDLRNMSVWARVLSAMFLGFRVAVRRVVCHASHLRELSLTLFVGTARALQTLALRCGKLCMVPLFTWAASSSSVMFSWTCGTAAVKAMATRRDHFSPFISQPRSVPQSWQVECRSTRVLGFQFLGLTRVL